MDDPPLVPHGDVPARCGDPEPVQQKDQPSVFTRGRSSIRSSCTSSEQQHPSESFSDLAVGTTKSPLTPRVAAVARTSYPGLSMKERSASHDEDELNSIMDNPNFAALEKRKVQRLFDRGVPFFTKRDMEDLQGQIEVVKDKASIDGQKFFFKSVTGRTVERAVPKGLSEKRRVGNKEGRLEPCILYNSYQALMHSRYHSDQALCAMQICHRHQIEPQQQSSLQDIWPEFWKQCLNWRYGVLARRVRAAIPYTNPVNKIFAFGCGSMSGEDSDRRRRSIMQHAFISNLRRALEQPLFENVDCFAQDPAYTEVDKELLKEFVIKVVEDPQGFIGVTDDSVVLSFCPNVPVRQIITDIARPAVLAWDTVTDEEDTIRRWTKRRGMKEPKAKAVAEELEACETDPPSSRVRQMIAEDYILLERLDPDLFGESSIYIRRPSNRNMRFSPHQQGPLAQFPRDNRT